MAVFPLRLRWLVATASTVAAFVAAPTTPRTAWHVADVAVAAKPCRMMVMMGGGDNGDDAEEEGFDDFVDPYEYILGEDIGGAAPISPLSLGSPAPSASSSSFAESTAAAEMGMEQILFIEVGFGNDQHGQDATKAAVRACRNAIEFNSIPSIRELVPGGYDGMKLHVQLGLPAACVDAVDLGAVAAVFPYGRLLPIAVEPGGLLARSGIALREMGDRNDEMIIAVACVTVGY